MDNNYTIRPVQAGDVEQIQSLILHSLRTEFFLANGCGPFMRSDLDDLLHSYGGPRDLFLVAVSDNNAVVGTVAIKEDDHNTALLRRVFVVPTARGLGIGTSLLNAALKFCENHNYTTVNFYATDHMVAAIALCRKNGFRRVAAMTIDTCALLRFCRRIRKTSRAGLQPARAAGKKPSGRVKTPPP